MTTTPLPADVVCHLRVVLDAIGDALADNQLEPLLATERELALALARLTSLSLSEPLSPSARIAVRTELTRCRAALERCQRLGTSHEHYTLFMLEQLGCAGAYTRHGDGAPVGAASTLEARG